MESKNYTNIAGSAFQPFVSQQLKARKKVISKEDRTTSDLLWLNNKSLWVRISSGTDVESSNTLFDEKGDILSKKYILQAGLTDHTAGAGSYRLRSGFGPDGAYGIGGTEQFGLRPMPGLEGLSIKTGGKLGTLREATFEFTCYNLEQLNIMDALYMKLGFSILIEWGHIPYLENDGTLKTNPQPMNFYGIKNKEDLMVDIQKRRVIHSGNYDAMWGTVKNFSYSFEGNGEFKCKVDLVGAGDILESLKINQSGTAQGSSGSLLVESEYPVVANQNLSLLNEALFLIFDKNNNEEAEATGDANVDRSDAYFKMINPYYKKLDIYMDSLGTADISSYNNSTDELAKYGYQYSLINKSNTQSGNGGKDVNIPLIQYPSYFYSRLLMDYEITEGDSEVKEKGLKQVYITLGHLLVLIMATGGLYTKKDNKAKPFIYIDVNPDTNRCYTFPYHCSLDPTICLIGSEDLPFGIDNTLLRDLQKSYPFYDNTTQDYGGKFMWTLVNINFITSTLSKYQKQDSKGNVAFVDFLQDILTGISKACGGLNEFRIVPDDDTRCVRIFDDKRISKPLKVGESPYDVIPVLGKNSLAYSFNYTSKIAPNMASQITIAAQAQPEGVGEEALSFSHLTKGLINRLSPIIISSTSEENNAKEGEAITDEQRFIESRNFVESIYNALGSGTASSSENTETFEEENTETNADTKNPTIKGVTKDTAKGKLSDALTAVIGNLEKIYKSKKVKTDDDEISLTRIRQAKIDILADFDWEDFKKNSQAIAPKKGKFDPENFDMEVTAMYDFIIRKLSDNKYYEAIDWKGDTDLENLWQNELDRLGKIASSDL